jgi:hypothetical protein
MSLLLLLNPKQYGGEVTTPDTSDILDVYRRKKRQYDELEEQIAAQILKKRQKDVAIPETVNKIKLAKILANKLDDAPKRDEVSGQIRSQRIKLITMVLLMDDDE